MTESEGETARIWRVVLSDGSFCWAKMSLAGIPRGMIRGIESQPCRDPSVRDYMGREKGGDLSARVRSGREGDVSCRSSPRRLPGFSGAALTIGAPPSIPVAARAFRRRATPVFGVPRVSMNRHRQGAGHGRDPEHSGDHQKSFREDDPRTRPRRRGTLPTFHFPEEEFPS
uniref:Uncharacterized protein n=1 Tax=Leptospirillum ferrodiazotrophum TaxID=412449 RepID=C6HYX2_9BACT|nr:MAG: hypothetical protein UBAL3_94320013 [Leptospirillum ferrodiazotrophum]